MDRRRNRQRGAGPPGRRQRMQLGRRMVHRQGLGGRRQCRTRPCCGSERMDLGRRRRFLCPGLLRRRGPCVRRYRGEGRLRLWRCAGGRACGRGRRLRGLLATPVVRGIIAGFARTESGRTAVDRRRTDARGGSELSGRRRLIAASGCWLAGAAKARQSLRAALQLRLEQIAPAIRGRRCGIRGRRLRPARAVRNCYCGREQQACCAQHALTARQRLPRSRSAHHRRPRHPGNCQSEPPSRSCAGASGPRAAATRCPARAATRRPDG